MKLSKIAIALMISLSCMFAPVKKAEAGFVVGITGGTASGVLIMLGGAGLGFASPLFENMSEKINMGGVVFLLGVAVLVLDADSDTLNSNLAQEFPAMPDYIINEAAEMVKEKAALIPFNPEGLKAVSLTEAEVAELEAAIPSTVSAETVNAFKTLLTKEVVL